ncbi:putative iron-regulated membrane protein [Pedobacter cryoconitis]|uniref:Putative iron-regulated membrane protein n=1 Tax=Pedobacter cryoconitis TaxID=188932 RepID=A0A7W8ZJD7_9SPHI|nr:PepSY-associated TM helix domain-containing protein [Pedobacter cryoconitis]MBB5635096.1 putative iron-regulated membrane protein [Pedobacter cryoconitis]
MKNIWRNIHLWLGLAAGLIFFTECLSGTLLVFEDEITEALHASRYQVNQVSQAIPLDSLANTVRMKMPKGKISTIKVYSNPYRTVEINVKEKKGKEKGGGKRGGKGIILFLNPYTAEITGQLNPAAPTFFSFMLDLHQSLLTGKVGKTILGISTFVVLIILITGMVLWFPKKRKQLKARLKVKTDGSWKRINHDLHVVLGFYCSFFILILLVTSLSWSFKWANTALYTITGSKPGFPEKVKSLSPQGSVKTISYQQALEAGRKQFSKAPYWSISMPKQADEPITITSASTDALHRNGFDNLSLDQRTGAILQVSLLKDMPGGWQLRRYMKPVHTGAIGGIPTKLMAFFVSLISATFPVTGTILWLNRMRKKKKTVQLAK